MVVNKFWALLLCVINVKLGMRREKYMPEERRQNSAETDRESCCNQEEWLEEI